MGGADAYGHNVNVGSFFYHMANRQNVFYVFTYPERALIGW